MDEPLLCVGSKQPEEITRLSKIVIAPVMVVATDDGTFQTPGEVSEMRIFYGSAKTVRS
jgi:hypothetical protein